MLFFFNNLRAQTPVKYEAVVEVPCGKEGDIFSSARKWFSESFKDSKMVLDINDKESGELSGNFTIPFSSNIHWGSDCTKGFIHANISIYIKEGKYKYEIKNFNHDASSNSCNYSFGVITDDKECPVDIKSQNKKWENKVWKELQARSESAAENLISSLNASMQNTNNNDW